MARVKALVDGKRRSVYTSPLGLYVLVKGKRTYIWGHPGRRGNRVRRKMR